jgi:hypothetical protein
MSGVEYDLVAQTWEYLVGLAGLACFYPFWKFVNGTPQHKQAD